MKFDKPTLLFVFLATIFTANVLIAELIGVKIFALDLTLGLEPQHFSFLGFNFGMNFTTGVLIWPIVFVLTDIVNDYYGVKGVRYLTFISVAIIIYAYFVYLISIAAVPAPWWLDTAASPQVPHPDQAFRFVLGQGQNIIIASLIAFIIGQFLDAFVFRTIKRSTFGRSLWLRATASTIVSQFIDSVVVIVIAFRFGQNWTWSQTWSVALNNYLYKGLIALLLIPLLTLIHAAIARYLGPELSNQMQKQALDHQ